MRQDLVVIGKLGKPHGLKGELKVGVEPAYEDALLESDILFVQLGSQVIPHFIEYVRGGGSMLIKLEEVDDQVTASLLQHKPVLLPADQLPAEDTEAYPLPPWEGFILEDEARGTIGPIRELIEMPQQILAAADYEGREVLIPLHEDLILSVDPGQKHILLRLPEGLLDLDKASEDE
jgi:16S rRNA processing protein RimM